MKSVSGARGISLLAVSVFLAALSLIGTWSLVGYQQRSALQTQRWKMNAWKKTLEAKKEDIITLILHRQNWRKILEDNSNGNVHCRRCFTDTTSSPPYIASTDCCRVNNSSQLINIMDLSGRSIVQTGPNMGFQPDGQLCSNFSAGNNNTNCVFRYEVRVKATCGTNTKCDNADFQITGSLSVSDGPYRKFDLTPYNIGLSR